MEKYFLYSCVRNRRLWIYRRKGRTYGTQVYKTGKRWDWTNGKTQKDNEIEVISSDCEKSFTKEIEDIIINKENIAATAEDGLKAMDLMERIYKSID